MPSGLRPDKPTRINFPLLFVVLLVAAGLFAVGWQRIAIDTNIVSSLPQDDPIIRDAVHIFSNHPFQDQLTIDVALDADDPDLLVQCGFRVQSHLEASGLFKGVGMADVSKGMPQLMQTVMNKLPVLFTARELDEKVTPLLAPERVARRLEAVHQGLLQLEGIGQAAALAQDPLGLRDLVLGKLLYMAPTQTARIYKGQLISGDGRHLLVAATPVASGADTAFARRLSAYIAQMTNDIQRQYAAQDARVTLTPVGAYRAALDNEVIVRADVQKALLWSSVGIALLLLLAFPRPLIGLLSLMPAVVGALIAFFVFALIRPTISIMVLGFGGALISITVDHGIAYLLFLDRPRQSFGKEASREVWAVGLLAALTTVGAFGALMTSDFPLFQQLGLFTALGICFSFLFVHTVFPLIFPSLAGARDRRLSLPWIADSLFSAGPRGAVAALAFFVLMLFFAKPGFNANLSAMNTVSQATQAAEAKLTAVWGDIFSKIFLMTEADSLEALQAKGDRLLASMEAERDGTLLAHAFLPSMIFPGPERSAANLSAWSAFWNEKRLAGLRQALQTTGRRFGFTPAAFDPFYALLNDPDSQLAPTAIPQNLWGLMGISASRAAPQWRQFASLTLPSDYPGSLFYERFGELVRVFDPGLFASQLGQVMYHTFMKLLGIIGPAVVILLLVFFLDLKLTLVALTPVVFAMVCTLGTLNLIGRPLDIPSLMLAVIVLGMGIDYSLFMVCSYQRYGSIDHPSFTLIRSAVVMTSASTLIGFGVLATAEHALLKSVGITSLLGIGYSALGAFLILPPLLKPLFENPKPPVDRTAGLEQRVLARYRRMEPYARMFARFKLRLDPMFAELPGMVDFAAPPHALVDIGTGYGVPACWLVETYPTAKIYGIDPLADRVRVAARALGESGSVSCSQAPDLPPAPDGADGAFMLDMIHYLGDAQLSLTLARLRVKLSTGAPLVIRAVMTPQRRVAGCWWVDRLRHRLKGLETFYRSQTAIESLLRQTGFAVEKIAASGRKGDLLWVRSIKIHRPAA